MRLLSPSELRRAIARNDEGQGMDDIASLHHDVLRAWDESAKRYWKTHDGIPTAFLPLANSLEKLKIYLLSKVKK